jgi:hypothetical protein
VGGDRQSGAEGVERALGSRAGAEGVERALGSRADRPTDGSAAALHDRRDATDPHKRRPTVPPPDQRSAR